MDIYPISCDFYHNGGGEDFSNSFHSRVLLEKVYFHYFIKSASSMCKNPEVSVISLIQGHTKIRISQFFYVFHQLQNELLHDFFQYGRQKSTWRHSAHNQVYVNINKQLFILYQYCHIANTLHFEKAYFHHFIKSQSFMC